MPHVEPLQCLPFIAHTYPNSMLTIISFSKVFDPNYLQEDPSTQKIGPEARYY